MPHGIRVKFGATRFVSLVQTSTELAMKVVLYEKCVRYETPKEFFHKPLCGHARRI